ncbi:MAG: sugar ABC transporter permease [Bacteroidetes bacterium]|nr:sugar ABC transporter permease [Bacteroidota bacterium]
MLFQHYSIERKRLITGCLLFLPVFIFLFAIFIVPLLSVIKQSFLRYDIATHQSFFAGLDNYITIMKDSTFHISLINAFVFTSTAIVFHMLFGWIFALMLWRAWPIDGLRSFFKSIILIPWIFSAPAAALIFKLLYHPQGFLNYFSMTFFDIRIGFLSDPKIALFSVLAVCAWKDFVMYMVLLLGGLQRIPESLYEAAKLDGCTPIKTFRYITFPIMKPLTLILILIDFVTTINHFDLIWVMTKGGPLKSTYLPGFLIYEKGIQRFDLGYATALSMVMLFIVIIVMVLYLKISKEEEQNV